jgi:hypothetical protein
MTSPSLKLVDAPPGARNRPSCNGILLHGWLLVTGIRSTISPTPARQEAQAGLVAWTVPESARRHTVGTAAQHRWANRQILNFQLLTPSALRDTVYYKHQEIMLLKFKTGVAPKLLSSDIQCHQQYSVYDTRHRSNTRWI